MPKKREDSTHVNRYFRNNKYYIQDIPTYDRHFSNSSYVYGNRDFSNYENYNLDEARRFYSVERCRMPMNLEYSYSNHGTSSIGSKDNYRYISHEGDGISRDSRYLGHSSNKIDRKDSSIHPRNYYEPHFQSTDYYSAQERQKNPSFFPQNTSSNRNMNPKPVTEPHLSSNSKPTKSSSLERSRNFSEIDREFKFDINADTKGCIFFCNHKTENECFRLNLFGLPKSDFVFVKQICPGDFLFLFNLSSKALSGIFQATSKGKLDINHKAFGGSFPAQVKVRRIQRCSKIYEHDFKAAIISNYFSTHKFKSVLNSDQIRSLIRIFKEKWMASKPTSYTYTRIMDKGGDEDKKDEKEKMKKEEKKTEQKNKAIETKRRRNKEEKHSNKKEKLDDLNHSCSPSPPFPPSPPSPQFSVSPQSSPSPSSPSSPSFTYYPHLFPSSNSPAHYYSQFNYAKEEALLLNKNSCSSIPSPHNSPCLSFQLASHPPSPAPAPSIQEPSIENALHPSVEKEEKKEEGREEEGDDDTEEEGEEDGDESDECNPLEKLKFIRELAKIKDKGEEEITL